MTAPGREAGSAEIHGRRPTCRQASSGEPNRQWSLPAVGRAARYPFPVSSTAPTIGEQKANVKSFPKHVGRPLILAVVYTSVLRQLRGCGEDKVPTKASASSDHIFSNHGVSIGLRRIFSGAYLWGRFGPAVGGGVALSWKFWPHTTLQNRVPAEMR